MRSSFAPTGRWPRPGARHSGAAGRLGFDYGCLLAALCATGASPQPSMVLLAYAAAGIVALLPLTPGGLGIVEASLSGLLVLARRARRRATDERKAGPPR